MHGAAKHRQRNNIAFNLQHKQQAIHNQYSIALNNTESVQYSIALNLQPQINTRHITTLSKYKIYLCFSFKATLNRIFPASTGVH